MKQVRELSERATGGPWETDGSRIGHTDNVPRGRTCCVLAEVTGHVKNRHNAAFIVAAANYVREMLAKAPSAVENND